MITEKIDTALSAVFEHFYSYMPEFEDGEEPETYAVYNLSYRDTFYSSGKANIRQYALSVSVFSPQADAELYDKVQAAIENVGGVFTGTTDLSQFDIYPNKKNLVMEFTLYEERT